MIKEMIKGALIVVGLTIFFLSTLLLSNFVNYGTFTF